MTEPTTMQILKHLNKFKNVYDEKGNFIRENDMPDKTKLTVLCEDSEGDRFLLYDQTLDEIGLEALIAKSWILQSDLRALLDAA